MVCCCILLFCWLLYFFFQAEDGIRATSVTGVQTCALPICIKDIIESEEYKKSTAYVKEAVKLISTMFGDIYDQIGRASCRERA